MQGVNKKFDKDGYMMTFCPFCGANISYKYNKDYEIMHPCIKEITGYQCELIYKCNVVNKLFCEVS